MISIRNRFGKWVSRVAGGFGPPQPRLAAGDHLRTANIAWGVILVVVLLVSAAIIHWSSTAMVAEIAIAALWGLFIGISMLFFLPPKLLITMMGGVVGVGVSDLAGLAEVVETTAMTIKRIVQALNSGLEGAVTLHPISAWLFLVLLAACCIPAYQKQE